MAPTVVVRHASEADLPGIMEVEQSWPQASRADAAMFKARLRKFPQGFIVACVRDGERESVVGTLTAMPMHYDPARITELGTWDAVTNRGYLPDPGDLSPCLSSCLSSCNALYIVSGVLDAKYRGSLPITIGIQAEVAVARHLGLRYVVAGAVIPGYRKYCEQYGDIPAAGYCAARRGSRFVDPLLAMYESIGFRVRDGGHVLRDYYPDADSRDHAAIVVCDLAEDAAKRGSGDLADEFLELSRRASRYLVQKGEAHGE